MENKIKLGGQEATLLIEVLGYENPLATNESDANWLDCRVSIRAGPFSGIFDADLMTDDLVGLHDDLQNAVVSLSGTVSFRTTEGDITLEIVFNKRGGATVSGTVEPRRSLGSSLAFEFETDQSCLTETLRQVEQVLREFPSKQIKSRQFG